MLEHVKPVCFLKVKEVQFTLFEQPTEFLRILIALRFVYGEGLQIWETILPMSGIRKPLDVSGLTAEVVNSWVYSGIIINRSR